MIKFLLQIDSVTKHVRIRPRNITIEDGRNIGQSYLQIKMLHRFFRENRLKLGCFVNIFPVYEASTEIEIIEEVAYIAPITGDASPHSHREYFFFHKQIIRAEIVMEINKIRSEIIIIGSIHSSPHNFKKEGKVVTKS